MQAAKAAGPDPQQQATWKQTWADLDGLTEAQAAESLGMTKRALERRRGRGSGPKWRYCTVRNVTIYDQADLDEWVRSEPKGLRLPPSYWDRD